MDTKLLKITSFLCLTFIASLGYCQDVPLGTLPLFYNSSFAGEADVARINSNLSYSSLPNINEISFLSSYDQFIPALRSGIGINAGFVNASGFLKSNYSTFGLAIAPKFSLKGKLTISPSLDFQYGHQNSTNYDVKNYTTRAGILINTAKFFIGYSFDVFKNMNIEDLASSERRQINKTTFDELRSFLQLGYTFQRSRESRFSFTPQILLGIRDYPGNSLHVGEKKFMVNFRYDKILWGISDNGLHIGWQSSHFRVMAINNVERILDTEKRANITTLSLRYCFGK